MASSYVYLPNRKYIVLLPAGENPTFAAQSLKETVMAHVNTSEHIERGASFPEFALRCACMFLREVSVVRGGVFGVQIPKAKTGHYHRRNLARAKDRLQKLEGMSARERLRWAAKETRATFETERAAYRKQFKDRTRVLKMHEEMLAQVIAWEPPPDHHRLKEVMLQQVNETLEGLKARIEVPKRRSAQQFLKTEIASLKRDVAFHGGHLARDREMVNRQNKWIGDLTKSLGAVRAGNK